MCHFSVIETTIGASQFFFFASHKMFINLTGKICIGCPRETSVSRHNGGQSEGTSCTPRYHSAVMFEGYQREVSLNGPPYADKRESLGQLYA